MKKYLFPLGLTLWLGRFLKKPTHAFGCLWKFFEEICLKPSLPLWSEGNIFSQSLALSFGMNRNFFDEGLPTLSGLRTKNNDEGCPIILNSEGVFLMSRLK